MSTRVALESSADSGSGVSEVQGAGARERSDKPEETASKGRLPTRAPLIGKRMAANCAGVDHSPLERA